MRFQQKCHVFKKKGIQVVTGAKVLPETLQTVKVVTIDAEINGA